MVEVPKAIEVWEQDWANYIQRTQETLPEKMRTNILLGVVPQEFEDELRLRYMHEDIDYKTLRAHVFDYALLKGVRRRGS